MSSCGEERKRVSTVRCVECVECVERARLQRRAETYRGDLGPDVALALHHVLVTGLKQLQHLGDVDADGAWGSAGGDRESNSSEPSGPLSP